MRLVIVLAILVCAHVAMNVGPPATVGRFDNNSPECAVCGLLVNQIEGLVAENQSESYIKQKLKADFCDKYNGTRVTCDLIVDAVPFVIDAVEKRYSVGVICVQLGLCERPFAPRKDFTDIPRFTIDLDLPAQERWNSICSIPKYKVIAQQLVKDMMRILPSDIDQVGVYLNDLYFPAEYAAEIRGCADSLGVDFGWLSILNIAYEISDACTSIVAQNSAGKVFHARNLDFLDGTFLTDMLRNLTIEVDFVQKKALSFTATTFVGYVGVLSGMKPDGFSITVDTKNNPDGIIAGYNEIIAAIKENKNASMVSFLTRSVLETEAATFDEALEHLAYDELVTDVYYIMAGVKAGEGAVITRNMINGTDIWRLDAPNRWFLVETNYDHWSPIPWTDNRVTPSNDALHKIGQKDVDFARLRDVLTIKPVLNLQTIYTIFASPADKYYESKSRYCNYPCTE